MYKERYILSLRHGHGGPGGDWCGCGTADSRSVAGRGTEMSEQFSLPSSHEAAALIVRSGGSRVHSHVQTTRVHQPMCITRGIHAV